MESSDSDDVSLEFDSCFKGCVGLNDSTTNNLTANDPKKRKRKSTPSATFLPVEDLPKAEGSGKKYLLKILLNSILNS